MYVLPFLLSKPACGRWLWLVLGLLLGSHAATAQIVDDSTKALYGPKTTRVIYEREVARDSVRGTPLDTTLTQFAQERFWLHDTTFQQNVGTFATASRPLLFQPNLALGARFGRNVFDRNTRDASQVPYYDSRSPYSFFRYIQGARGEQVFELTYARSFKENFNIGFNYERIASNQVVGTSASQWQVEHNNFTLFSRFQTQDGRYHLLANYSASRQRNRELGSIFPTDEEARIIKQEDKIGNTLFKYADSRTYLMETPGINIDDRDQVHVFQSYRLAQRGFTAYHMLDARRQYNGYNNDALPRTSTDTLLFYPRTPYSIPGAGFNGQPLRRIRGVYRNATATNDRATYQQLENTVGLLGRTERVEYNLYGRVRNAALNEKSTPGPARDSLNRLLPILRSGVGLRLRQVFKNQYTNAFIGGTAAFNYRTIYAVQVAGEYKFANEFWLRGSIRTGPLSAEVLQVSAAPTLTQLKFVGNHYIWPDSTVDKTNSFKNAKTTQLTVRLQQRLPLLAGHSIDARVSLASLASTLYYDSLGGPAQDDESRRLLIVSARHRFQVSKFFFDNQATYTSGADDSNPSLRIPKLVAELRGYYQTNVFRKALLAQMGLEYYYQTSWRGYDYSPSTQQFYVQDGFTIPAYGVLNAFLAADIKAASIFIKGAYLNQGLGANGYFAAPYYSGYPRRLQFGVRWRFFN